jgi:glutamyl-tRNA synthetase
MSGPRVRFAPSPTGFLHVGSARSCLFNWLFARHNDGTLVLRIEDTDAERNRPDLIEGIPLTLSWLGIDIDEGPYLQSSFLPQHKAAAEALWDGGYLYACDCTREQIDERIKGNAKPGYDGYCRDRNLLRSATTALRFRVPDTGVTVVHDLVRGDVEFPLDSYEDFVVVRSNGTVLFTLANAVDDREMAITHVIRGEDLFPTTPKQVMMWLALNECSGVDEVALPGYAHLPMLVNEQRKKLSKRKDPVAVESYRDEGYLPEALINYLSLLGWSPPGDEEIVPVATSIKEFRLEDVSHSPAFFDVKKLKHMNGEYIRRLSVSEFVERSAPWVRPWSTSWQPSTLATPWTEEQFDEKIYEDIAELIKERVATFSEIPAMVSFFFLPEVPFDAASFDKTIRNDEVAQQMLRSSIERFTSVPWDTDSLHEATLTLGEALGLPLRKAQAPLRCAVTGSTIGPPLFESLVLLGRDLVINRFRSALERVSS